MSRNWDFLFAKMNTLKIEKKNYKKILAITLKSIKQGKVVICPTDTVYGLVANATDKKAVEKVFRIKKREKTKFLPIFIKDLKMAKQLAKINKKQEEFLKKAWPGRVTVVLKRKRAKLYGINKDTIALRIPKHRLINKLLKSLDFPLSGTSANISKWLASGKIKEVLKQFQYQKEQPDLVVDAGDLKPSKASKVIDIIDKPKVLRK